MKKRTAQVGCGLLIVLWMILPLLSVLTAYAIGNAFGCQVDEGSAHSCVVAGQDIGEMLYTMGVMGWFMFVTIPSGLVALVIFLIVLLVGWLRRKKMQERSA